jgi:hypothetical protein
MHYVVFIRADLSVELSARVNTILGSLRTGDFSGCQNAVCKAWHKMGSRSKHITYRLVRMELVSRERNVMLSLTEGPHSA